MKKLNHLNKFEKFVNEYYYFGFGPMNFFDNWTKKPVDKEDVNSVDFEKLPEKVKNEIKDKKLFDREPGKRYYFDIEIEKEPTYQLVEIEDNVYLVNTEGYNYPRYIIKLDNFSD